MKGNIKKYQKGCLALVFLMSWPEYYLMNEGLIKFRYISTIAQNNQILLSYF